MNQCSDVKASGLPGIISGDTVLGRRKLQGKAVDPKIPGQWCTGQPMYACESSS